jgi:DNA-damage-inducible protein J
MRKTGYITARIESSLKAEAEGILASLGVSASDAVNMLYRQVVLNQGLPFEVRIPNAITLAALKSAKNHPENAAKYPSFSALLEDVDAEIAAESK